MSEEDNSTNHGPVWERCDFELNHIPGAWIFSHTMCILVIFIGKSITDLHLLLSRVSLRLSYQLCLHILAIFLGKLLSNLFPHILVIFLRMISSTLHVLCLSFQVI